MVFIQSNVATIELLGLSMIEEYMDNVDGARDNEDVTICRDVLKDDVGSLESSQIEEYLNDDDAHDDKNRTMRKEILKYDVGCDDNAPEGVIGETIGPVLENGEPVMTSLSAVDETSAWSAGSGGGGISSPGETWHSTRRPMSHNLWMPHPHGSHKTTTTRSRKERMELILFRRGGARSFR